MKTVGIIGGLSPESTITYYNWLNEGVRQRLGGCHNARIMLASLDFGVFVALKEKGDWDAQAALLAEAAQALEKAGADCIVLATNTMHKMADQIIASVNIPFIHLADATAIRIEQAGITEIGLLGTRYTMALDFYKGRLAAHGITIFVPDEAGIETVNGIIYDELCKGIINPVSRQLYRDEILKLVQRGAKGTIMGCTEITQLIGQDDSPVPVFDTTRIHVDAALDFIFAQ